MKRNSSRREFLQASTAGIATGLLVPTTVRAVSANDKLQHACIGVGGIGKHDRVQIAQHPKVEIVAICDIDGQKLEEAAQDYPSARKYTDWRDLLNGEADRTVNNI